jgi:hypothetical protein
MNTPNIFAPIPQINGDGWNKNKKFWEELIAYFP